MKFEYYFSTAEGILEDYKVRDATWALSSYLANDIEGVDHYSMASDDFDSDLTAQDNNIYNSMERDLDDSRMLSSESILNVSQKKSKTKLDKSKVVPSWSATNSLLLSQQKLTKTNTEPVAPLFRQPPTDYATLYTALLLTQEISAVVVGPSRKTIITLDMDLFQRALKIMQSKGHKKPGTASWRASLMFRGSPCTREIY